jgi:multidrug efflux pump subunit AcrA (membrane-fusion protein)
MRLVPIEAPAGGSSPPAGVSTSDTAAAPPAAAGGVPGMAPVTLDERARGLAGIQTTPARREVLSSSLRTVGTVVPDERRVHAVNTRITGWIEKLHVNFSGQMVRRGEPILRIYSPELLATQEEFLRALQAAQDLAAAGPEAQESGRALLEAARRRLQLFDVPRGFVDELARRGEPQRDVTLVAPASGFVTAKDVLEGQQVEAGMPLFTITDLSRVWVQANVYESEAALVQLGQRAVVSLPYTSGVQLAGTVTYIDPFVDPATRTLTVRLEFTNPDLLLKPAMYVDVTLDTVQREGVVIPEEAVLDSGTRRVVFVETAAGHYEPRAVRLGIRGDGKVQVLDGVRAGERVVARANFLLDSESRLRSALSGGRHGS